MEEVSVLALRTKFGEILELLEEKGEPILITKRQKIRAVLVTPEQFERRFLDFQAEAKKIKLLEGLRKMRSRRVGKEDSLCPSGKRVSAKKNSPHLSWVNIFTQGRSI